MYRVCAGRELVLASGSPRRREMLAALGLAFVVRPVEVDETLDPAEDAARAAARLSLAKARAARLAAGQAVLTADTLVGVAGRVLGKPADPAEAMKMLASLSGQEHQVLTGFCLGLGGEIFQGSAVSRVRFRALSPAEIAAYVATGEPLDKAGAYGVQGIGAALVEHIEGSYSNVVGLPLAAVVSLLLEKGVIEPSAG